MFLVRAFSKFFHLTSQLTVVKKSVLQRFNMQYISSPHAHQKEGSTVFDIMYNMQIFNDYKSVDYFPKGVKDCTRKILQQFSLAYIPPPHAHQYRKGTVFDAYNNMQIFHAYSIPKILPAFNIGFILAYVWCFYLKVRSKNNADTGKKTNLSVRRSYLPSDVFQQFIMQILKKIKRFLQKKRPTLLSKGQKSAICTQKCKETSHIYNLKEFFQNCALTHLNSMVYTPINGREGREKLKVLFNKNDFSHVYSLRTVFRELHQCTS